MTNLKELIGLGVAGNFAHHLEQAGELEDFKNVVTKEENAPKGIFPFYLPNSESFLGIFPISSSLVELPLYEANAQVEPEVILLCDIIYEDDKVIDLKPLAFTAFNDCTIRKEGAKKISEKKNWGSASKGIATEWIEIDKFEEGGIMDRYHLSSYLKRDGVVHPYGVDAPLLGYSYFYGKLKNWLIEKMNEQEDINPLEDILAHLKNSNYPSQALISIGATAYSKFGEKHYLQKGDEIFVMVYDASINSSDLNEEKGKVILKQKVS
ncbi:MAG: hypothetical protein KN64_08060 [Sulfurovum sp. AS07-7]|nr:MAG: hypothetical protein KN64_08060 [Sulfurovum sp. AS07-7]